MKEPVHKPKYPYAWGVVMAAIAGLYFYLTTTGNKFPEPGPNLEYDITALLAVDQVDTRFAETGEITPTVEMPRALKADASGNIYIGGKDAIAVYDASGKEIERIPVDGAVTCLDFTPDGRLLAGLDDRVALIGTDRKIEAVWGDFTARSLITAIAAGEDEIFLADAASRCVLRIDYNGTVLNRIGETDEARDVPGLEVPSPYFDLAFDSDGHLWVVNPGKLGLERYRSNGDIVTSWYRADVTRLDSFSGCCNPVQIAFNSEGRLVTGEKGPVRVKIFEVTSGEFEELVVGSSAFQLPQGIGDLAVDPDDRILVLDPKKNSVRIFEANETKMAAKPNTQ